MLLKPYLKQNIINAKKLKISTIWCSHLYVVRIPRNLPTNYLSVFGHFVGVARKGLKY